MGYVVPRGKWNPGENEATRRLLGEPWQGAIKEPQPGRKSFEGAQHIGVMVLTLKRFMENPTTLTTTQLGWS